MLPHFKILNPPYLKTSNKLSPSKPPTCRLYLVSLLLPASQKKTSLTFALSYNQPSIFLPLQKDKNENFSHRR